MFFFHFLFFELCLEKKNDDIQDRASRVSASSSAKLSGSAKEISGKVVEDWSESASNASEESAISSVAFSKELPRLEALEGEAEMEGFDGHRGGPQDDQAKPRLSGVFAWIFVVAFFSKHFNTLQRCTCWSFVDLKRSQSWFFWASLEGGKCG